MSNSEYSPEEEKSLQEVAHHLGKKFLLGSELEYSLLFLRDGLLPHQIAKKIRILVLERRIQNVS